MEGLFLQDSEGPGYSLGIHGAVSFYCFQGPMGPRSNGSSSPLSRKHSQPQGAMNCNALNYV